MPHVRPVATLLPLLGLALLAGPLPAQHRIAGPAPSGSVLVAPATASVTRPPADGSLAMALRRASAGRVVLGGVLGAAVGVLACNLISEAIEEAEDSTHCTTKGNLTFGIGGAALGVLVAVLTD